jgi:5-guanidino-2-oxopentanoate decarboxylase
MAQQLTCGAALIRLLEGYGVDTVFGIPGVHTLDLYRGLGNSRIRHIQPRHEQGAGFMADGYARVGRRPGVCFLITGPGVTNAATPLGQAYADSAPILLISSVTPSYSLGKGWGCLHEITDQQAVTAPLTAFSATALSPDELPELIGQAWSVFEAGRPRPVHISIPLDVLADWTDKDWATRAAPSRPMPDGGRVQAAADLLAGAARPILYLGGGAVEAGAPALAIAERLAAPVITSNAGKGIVSDRHPLSLGASIVRAPTRDYLARADVILAAGTELSETDSFVERLELGGKLIRIDIDRGKLGDLYPAEIGIQADSSAALALLDERLAGAVPARPRAEVEAELAEVRRLNEDSLSPVERQHWAIWQALRPVLPAETVVMGDITQLVYTGCFAFPVDRPGSWYYPAGYCTLGCALPMAIGAKLAAPERPVIAVAGDGGFMFTMPELAVAAELGQALPILLWNNDALGQIRDDMDARDIPRIGVEPRNPDFALLAQSFGCHAARPDSLDALADAMAQALAASAPTLIEVKQDAAWLA